MENIMDFVLDRSLVLIPVLIIIGKLMKELMVFPDKWIPLGLLPLGVAGAVLLQGVSAEAVIQGVLVTGCAVYGNQIFRQMGKKY